MKFSKFKSELKKEYNDTFKEIKVKRSFDFQFKFRYVFYAFMLFIGILLIGNHVSVLIYNSQLDDIKEAKLNSKDFNKIDNVNDYQKLKQNYSYHEKTSFLSFILTMEIGCAAKGGNMGVEPPADGGNSFDTNVQTKGIDEADISKCDGKYVYSLANNRLVVYDLNGNVISTTVDNGKEIYVSGNNIVSFGDKACVVYKFDKELIEKMRFDYEAYIDSRLVDNNVYLVTRNRVYEENILYGNCYYDDLGSLLYNFSIIDINLENYSYSMVQTLSGYNAVVYMSNSNFYVASSGYCNGDITSIMMYDINLNPQGIMRVEGTVLNQFSMDEYNGYLRVVSTDDEKEAERLNSISVFDLETLNRVGYLNEGIGIGRQIIKSVRFDKDVCYCVTYENTDPLYEISLSDPLNPQIVSVYKAPGYSNYLHNFVIGDKEYILGLGYTDSRINTKISIYVNEEETIQIGEDYILGYDDYYDQCDYISNSLNQEMFVNHKSLFIYNDGDCLYLGANVCLDKYVIFKIDVNDVDNLVSVYKTIDNDYDYKQYDCRAFLVDGKILVTTSTELKVMDWKEQK